MALTAIFPSLPGKGLEGMIMVANAAEKTIPATKVCIFSFFMDI